MVQMVSLRKTAEVPDQVEVYQLFFSEAWHRTVVGLHLHHGLEN